MECDIVATNPPFSLFREFMSWLIKSGKQFVVIGSMNAITYKEIFPLLKNNKVWLGNGFHNGNAFFRVEAPRGTYSSGVYDENTNLVKFRNCCWFTNIDHGRRHQPLKLMTMAENYKHSKHKEIRERKHYEFYDNYDAIDIPYTDAIPCDYEGVMGVPISFLDKYCPEQFEIVTLGIGESFLTPTKFYKYFADPLTGIPNKEKRDYHLWIKDEEGKYLTDLGYRVKGVFSRIMIRKKQ